ncbi:MAG TPA: Spy/CpxP family protein refolding chaperone [Pyrinomonadaceae bacterium]|jgi:Spy/CpxP family protein refolding chaperone
MSFKFKFISTLTVAGAIAAFAGASLAQDTTNTAPQPTDKPGHHRGDGLGRRGPGGPEGMRGGPDMFGPMMKGVNLTDAQKAQIKQIREANKPNPADFEAIKPLMEAKRNGTITADQEAQLKAFRQARQAKEESIRQQINAVFTPDQKAQIEKNKAEMKTRREDWRKDHPNGKSGNGTSPAATTSKPGIN